MNMKEKFVENMAENMPVLRKKLKLSQENLASRIGVSRYTVMLIENRKRKMTWTMFLALLLIFERNEETSKMIRTFEIYNEELEDFLTI